MRLKFAMPLRLLCTSAVISALQLAPTMAAAQHPRPKITGISHIAVYTSDAQATNHYYAEIIGARRETDPENTNGARYMINATQFIEVLPIPPNAAVNRLDHIGWKTDNV